MSKKLSKRQKTIESQRQLKQFIKNDLAPNMLKSVENLINDDELPEHFLEKGSYELTNYIINNTLKK